MAHSPTVGNLNYNVFWQDFKLPMRLLIQFAKFFKFIGKWTGLLGIWLVIIILSPVLIILGVLIGLIYSKLNKSSEKLKYKFEKEYKSFSFDRLKEEEKELEEILTTLKMMKERIPEKSRLFRSINYNLNSIVNNFEFIKNLLKSRYTLDKDSIFESDKEFEEYQKAMDTLNDVWKGESTKEEQEFIYRHNNK